LWFFYVGDQPSSFHIEILVGFDDDVVVFANVKFINYGFENINKNPVLTVEYFEIVDALQLQPVKSWDENCSKVGCIAVYCGKVRLIDNVVFN